MTNPTVREIVEAHLEREGYDGLYCDDGCCCPWQISTLKELIFCTKGSNAKCRAGFRQPNGTIGPKKVSNK